jgi:hypothetical protein
LPSQTAPSTCAIIEILRRQRDTGKQIAAEVGVSPATVSRILQRLGINKLSALEPTEPVRRYEREHPRRDHPHRSKSWVVSSKSATASPAIGRAKATAVGSVGNISRVAYSEILPDEKRRSCLSFLFNALRLFRAMVS